MSRKKKAAEAAAAETARAASPPNIYVQPKEERPFVMADDGPIKLKGVTSNQVKLKFDEGEPPRPTRGPMTGQRQMSDAEFLAQFGEPGELRVFRAAVEARRAKSPERAWIELPNRIKIRGDQVLAVCTNPTCRAWRWMAPANVGQHCFFCNAMKRSGAGMTRRASAEEEEWWWKTEREKQAKYEAERPARAAEERKMANTLMRMGKL